MTTELSLERGIVTGVSSAASAPKITYVRSGPSALVWLAEAVATLKGEDPLRPVTVVVPHYVVGRFVRRELGRHGGAINVRALRLVELASTIAPPQLAGGTPLDLVLEASGVRAVVTRAGTQLRELGQHLSLHDALVRLFREMRRQETDVEADLRKAPPPAAEAALRTYQTFRELTRDYVDATDVRDLATAAMGDIGTPPSALKELGGLVLFLLTRFDRADARLLAAAAQFRPLHAAFAWLPEDEDAKALSVSAARLLAEALDQARPAEPTSTPEPLAELRVLRAPDPAEEVREVVRNIAADLNHGIPLHRIALLYRLGPPHPPGKRGPRP